MFTVFQKLLKKRKSHETLRSVPTFLGTLRGANLMTICCFVVLIAKF
jgi:hypothetical protein